MAGVQGLFTLTSLVNISKNPSSVVLGYMGGLINWYWQILAIFKNMPLDQYHIQYSLLIVKAKLKVGKILEVNLFALISQLEIKESITTTW